MSHKYTPTLYRQGTWGVIVISRKFFLHRAKPHHFEDGALPSFAVASMGLLMEKLENGEPISNLSFPEEWDYQK